MKQHINRIDGRPYWHVVVSLLSSIIATVVVLYVGVKAIVYFAPFVIGWLVAQIAYPLVIFLEKKLKIVKKLGSALIVILVIVSIIGLVYLAISALWGQVRGLSESYPTLFADWQVELQKAIENMMKMVGKLPGGVKETMMNVLKELENSSRSIFDKVSKPTVLAVGNVAMKIPSVLVSVIVGFMSSYFFVVQREEIVTVVKRLSPPSITNRMSLVISNFKKAVGGYFKAQFKIMGVVGIMLFAGLTLLQIHYAVLIALLIAFLDFLPFFGTGTAMIPWALFEAATGDYKRAIWLVILYASTQVVRQIIQPKLVGDSMGLDPLPTLLFLFIGYRVGSVIGLIIAVPVGMIVINMFKAGAFDYIIDDVKILVDGLLSLRGNSEGWKQETQSEEVLQIPPDEK